MAKQNRQDLGALSGDTSGLGKGEILMSQPGGSGRTRWFPAKQWKSPSPPGAAQIRLAAAAVGPA